MISTNNRNATARRPLTGLAPVAIAMALFLGAPQEARAATCAGSPTNNFTGGGIGSSNAGSLGGLTCLQNNVLGDNGITQNGSSAGGFGLAGTANIQNNQILGDNSIQNNGRVDGLGTPNATLLNNNVTGVGSLNNNGRTLLGNATLNARQLDYR